MILFLVMAIVSPGVAQRVRFSSERLSQGEGCRASLADSGKPGEEEVVLSYELVDGGWANVSALLRRDPGARPVTFLFKTSVDCTLELKFIEADGATFGQRVKVDPADGGRRRLTIYSRDAEFWWGGDGTREKAVSFDLAVSGTTGEGKLTLSQARIGKAGEPSSFGPPTSASDGTKPPASGETPLLRAPYHGPLLDPDRLLAGYGTRQRRAREMIAEDPLVLEWLREMQDTGTAARQLLPSTPGGDEGHTFNNVLAAMAFMRHGERERAERILDFFRDAAADRDNEDPTLQSFYLRGEARGFFQRVSLKGRDGVASMHAPPDVDRWMGDMAWLLLACLDYEQTFDSQRYSDQKNSLADLLRSWYVTNPRGPGGYVQHGWRRGDSRLHEDHGHHEGNIDCYAVFVLLGDEQRAEQIRLWLEAELAGRDDLPLDLYTWRVLSFDGQQAELLDIPDFDLRYRKRVAFRDRTVVGPYSAPSEAHNIWLEGAAHMACAYAAAGDSARANFYANQLDAALIDQQLGGKATRSLPYTVNQSGDYGWVNPDEGFTSTAAWYVLAKQRFNPLRLKTAQEVHSD